MVRVYDHGLGYGYTELIQKNQKNGKPSHGILLCDLPPGKKL